MAERSPLRRWSAQSGGLVLGWHIDAGHGKRAVWYASATVAAIIVLRALATGSTPAAVVANAVGSLGWVSLHTDVDDGRVHPGEAVALHAEIPCLDRRRLGRRRSQRPSDRRGIDRNRRALVGRDSSIAGGYCGNRRHAAPLLRARSDRPALISLLRRWRNFGIFFGSGSRRFRRVISWRLGDQAT